MQPEKWQEVKGRILDNFSVEDQGQEHDEDQGGVDIEYLIFHGPLGKMKLSFVSKPVVLDKKTTYSKRIGSESSVEYVYSSNERSHKLEVYRWDEATNDWQEIDARKFSLT